MPHRRRSRGGHQVAEVEGAGEAGNCTKGPWEREKRVVGKRKGRRGEENKRKKKEDEKRKKKRNIEMVVGDVE